MDYCLNADAALWPKSHKPLPFNDLADCLGGLRIEFLYGGNTRTYDNAFTNIPLFLTELDQFLCKVGTETPSQWYVGFAPFAYGLFHNGSLLVSSRKGKAFREGIYDCTEAKDLLRLRAKVANDLKRYGKVQISGDQAGQVVSRL